jgi:hypothetical protein
MGARYELNLTVHLDGGRVELVVDNDRLLVLDPENTLKTRGQVFALLRAVTAASSSLTMVDKVLTPR